MYPFVLQANFINPQWMKNKDGETVPYAPFLYNELVNQLYLISSKVNTSYADLLDITIKEKDIMFNIAYNQVKNEQKSLEEFQEKVNKK